MALGIVKSIEDWLRSTVNFLWVKTEEKEERIEQKIEEIATRMKQTLNRSLRE